MANAQRERTRKPKPAAKGRLGRGILTREQVVDAAFELLGDSGLEQLSMHRLARHLGVGSMTLYSYVTNKQELIDALTERARAEAFKELSPPEDGLTWDEQLIAHFQQTRRLAISNVGIAQLLLRSGRMVAVGSPDILWLAERHLQGMIDAGMTPEMAGRTFAALQHYTLGFALRELGLISAGDSAQRDEQSLRELPEESFPALCAARSAFLSSYSEEQFDFGLRALLAGAMFSLARERETALA